ncbi:MAG: hypothetical protein ACJ747_08175 [Gaiellaceae bacterium]
MDVQITPEPSDAEREAIIRALELETETDAGPSPWRSRGLEPDGDQATAPRRQSRGAVRA